MWFALLFSDQNQLLAAAPAAPVFEMGHEYWRDVYAGEVCFSDGCQTAYLDVTDPRLGEKLESLEVSDDNLPECREAIDELTLAFRRLPQNHPRAA